MQGGKASVCSMRAHCTNATDILPTRLGYLHYSSFGALVSSAHNTIHICTKLLLALQGTAHWCAALNDVDVLSAVHTNCVVVTTLKCHCSIGFAIWPVLLVSSSTAKRARSYFPLTGHFPFFLSFFFSSVPE